MKNYINMVKAADVNKTKVSGPNIAHCDACRGSNVKMN
jgi:hypothetical protein